MSQNTLLEQTKQKLYTFQTLLNKRLYLFNMTPSLADPKLSRQGTTCTIFIPNDGGRLNLKDNLGQVGGSISYRIQDNKTTAFKYSFNFTHSDTWLQFVEDGKVTELQRYAFHFDLDEDREEEITHPKQHLQVTDLRVPRFAVPETPSEITAFIDFLNLVEKTFYDDERVSTTQDPKLSRKEIHLTAYS